MRLGGSCMSLAKLLGLKKDISDAQISEMINSDQQEIQIGDIVIKKPRMKESGVTG